jgi:L-aspartate oxidase
MAKRAQAQLVNMEFIQFHPTTLYDPSSHRRFLISEAVRGEGGILLNSSGQAFMESIHPEKDLAPRDVVARAILNQMILERQDCMYLDISFKQSDWVKERFPTIYHHCLERGLDMTKEPIPVVPAAHYTCGGVKTNLSGETTLKGLYAVGEVACTGLHGANRLASTSLLEGLTWGYLAAEDIVQKSQHSAWTFYPPEGIRQWEQATGPCALSLIHQDWQTLKQTMWNYVGLSRSPKRLRRALAMVMELDAEVQAFYKHAQLHDELIGLRNGLEVALSVIKSSMRNKQSMGCFYLEND